MSWPARTWIAGELVTAAIGNAYWRDPQVDLRAGGLAFAQARHFIFASSATQFGHLDRQTNKIPRFNGVTNAWEMVLPLELAWPVGSIYRAVVATNPATLFGFGTWAAVGAGRVAVCFDAGQIDFDTVEETGGTLTHALTISDMPVHTHVQNSHNHTQDAHNHTQDAHDHNLSNYGANQQVWSTPQDISVIDNSGSMVTTATTATNIAATAVNQETVATNQNAGSGTAHNNVMPSIVAYVWKRTA